MVGGLSLVTSQCISFFNVLLLKEKGLTSAQVARRSTRAAMYWRSGQSCPANKACLAFTGWSITYATSDLETKINVHVDI